MWCSKTACYFLVQNWNPWTDGPQITSTRWTPASNLVKKSIHMGLLGKKGKTYCLMPAAQIRGTLDLMCITNSTSQCYVISGTEWKKQCCSARVVLLVQSESQVYHGVLELVIATKYLLPRFFFRLYLKEQKHNPQAVSVLMYDWFIPSTGTFL